jgi:predicted alpha-1,2-mannosidase
MKKQLPVFSLIFFSIASVVTAQQNYSSYVNPFIGTGGHGHMYPGATLPFGMVQVSPDNGTSGWDWCSGYNYSDTTIIGFSQTHLSGTGIGDLCDISLMPLYGQYADTTPIKSTFSHAKEKASPGYYSVLLDNGISVALTASKRTGIQQYRFPAGKKPQVKLDLGWAINWDTAKQTLLTKVNDSLYTGYRFSNGWSKNQKVFFALQFSRKVLSIDSIRYKQGQGLVAFFQFETNTAPLEARVALSNQSVEGAIGNLKETASKSFAAVQQEAAAIWEKELSAIKINSFDKNVLVNFYTALYHTYLTPVLYSDAGEKDRYTTFSLWDTFRAANPLLSITQPGMVKDIINSFLAFYDEKGLLPVWDLMNRETNTMTGYHAVPVIADAILKNTKGFDWEKAYKAMLASSMQNQRGTDAYRTYGYLPQDKHGWSVTITLEYAYDDWCIAQVAKKLGKEKDYTEYIKRSSYYRPLFDASTGFFRARNSDGQFVKKFDPYYSEHGFDGQYIEGTAWQHSWFVPHNVEDLIRLHGGLTKFLNKLDSLWTVSSKVTGENTSADITGMIGQYAHGNEPSHHIAYLYAAAGLPYKTAEKVRQITTTLYKNSTDGLCGNEDCGQMSAWYVFNALGFYPMNPSSGEYYFGSPLINHASIRLAGGKIFEMVVHNNSYDHPYIASVYLNGKPYRKNYISHSDLMKGGKLIINMSKEPVIRTEVLVVGGSTGGTAAGIQSARLGVKTLIMEETPWLGGMLSAAGVTATDGNHNLPSGMWEEFRQALYQHYHTKNLNTGWVSNTLFEPYVADSIFKAWAAKEKDLTVQYGWYFDSALVSAGKIVGARFINREKEHITVYADIVMDGTDLGDVYANAGAGYDVGMEDAAYSGEKEAPGKNNIIQDLTWAATLRDYGKNADTSILIKKEQFRGISLNEFDCSTSDAPCPEGKPYNGNTQKVLDYGKLPKGKYMLNWPAHGNDYYQNGINIKPINRYAFYEPARKQTLAFLYFIQQQLGFKNIGLDTTEFPSKDHLALMPYHREGRRLKGIVRFTLPHMNHTFEQAQALYRTGISVGDYPVDHHHGKNPNTPVIHFPAVNSFSIPMGSLIPASLNGMVVCEKGISVSNLANGSTRLQPCVLLTGQAAGVLAALAVQEQKEPREVSVRKVQSKLLEQKAFLLPYVDVLPSDHSFEAVQRIGATGILRGTGRKEGWANKMYFYPDSLCNGEVLLRDLKALTGNIALPAMGATVTFKDILQLWKALTKTDPAIASHTPENKYGEKALTRKEVAVLLDTYCNPFAHPINHEGKWIRETRH